VTNSLYQTLGAMALPTKATDVDATALTLAPLDPARDAMLALFAAAIVAELGPAWDVVAAAVPSLAGVSVVADTWPGEPSPEIVLQRKCKFPCLFLSRSGVGTFQYITLARRQKTQKWGLHYIVSPVDVGELRKVGDILARVSAVLLSTIERGGHPSYQSGSKVLASVGLDSVELDNDQAGQARFAADPASPLYRSLSCELTTTESTNWVPGTAPDFNGASYSLGTGDSSGILPDMVVFDTNNTIPPPQ
jgi:hypothetical protein